MKIAWISKIEWNLPHKTSRLKLSEALQDRGHDITLYMIRKFGEKKQKINNIVCIPTISLPFFSGFIYGIIVFFYFPIILKRKNVDIILVDFSKVPIPFIIPLKILKKPIILDIRTLPIDKNDTFTFKFLMFLSKYIADGFTTITPELKKIIKHKFNIKKLNIGLWSSGVSLVDFNNNIINEDFHGELKNNHFVLMYHGDYSPTRGIENLIKAISLLNQSLKNKTKLIIIGMPKEKTKSLLDLCKNEGVKNQINIISKISYKKITQYVKITDIGIIPLPPENIWWKVSAPLKTLEYLAAGKPILATNIPFHNRIIKKGKCGIIINSASPKDIARGISMLYKDKKILKNMGDEGRKIVEKYYSWDIMAKKLEKYLEKYIS